jgi:hypothetical protein
LAAEYALQIKQGLKSCLDTAIIWILSKFTLCSSNETCNITVQCVYVIIQHPIPPRLCRLRLPRLCRSWWRLVLGGLLLLGMVSDGIIKGGEGTYLLGTIWWRVLGARILVPAHVWVLQRRCRSVSERHRRWTILAGEWLLLLSCVFLMCLNGRRPGFDEGILDRSGNLWEEHWACIDRSGDWFFPCLQHLFHLPTNIVVD